MSDNRSGSCISGKVRYANEEQAAIALERVREDRESNPDGLLPERIFYYCPRCEGWHLSSRPPAKPDSAPKGDGETWEEYAHRLERRITDQRVEITRLIELRHIPGDRAARKKIEGLVIALGRMTKRWEDERAQKHGLVERIAAMEPVAPVSATEKRYEIGVLCGPCSCEEIEQIAEEIVERYEPRVGAVVSIAEWTEEP